MADVKLMVQGEAMKRADGWNSSPNTTLIRSGGKKILVDPGNHPGLPELLELRALWPEEIDVVFLTHYHLDHTLNASLFEHAEIMDVAWRYNGNDIIEHEGTIRGTDIEIVPTPGHTLDCSSLMVKTVEGMMAVTGDLFWFQRDQSVKMDIPSLIDLPDELALDRKKLMDSRRTILERTDRIIPGHGTPFDVPGQ